MMTKYFLFLEEHPFFKKYTKEAHYYHFIFASTNANSCEYFELYIPFGENEFSIWEYNCYFIKEKWNQKVENLYNIPTWAKDLFEKATDAMYERDKVRRIFSQTH